MNKASIHIEKGSVGEFFHNDRSKPTANSIFSKENNIVDKSAEEAIKIYRDELEKRSQRYTERTGQKLQKRAITLLSAVVNIKPDTSMEELKKLGEKFEKEFGTKIIQIAIHKDEGHLDENGNPIINYHAHILMMGIDETGQSIKRKFTFTKIREMQDWASEILKMERGKKRKIGERKRFDTYEFKNHKKMETETLKKEKAKDVNRAENLKLKLENKKLKNENEQLKEELNSYKNMFEDYRKEAGKNVSALKKEISELRKKMIQANKTAEEKLFTAEDYKILSKLKKELNAKTVNEIEQKIKELRKKIDEKILFSNSVHIRRESKNDFNKKLYVFAKLINGDYKSLEKMGISVDDYFFKKIPESDEILVGNKQKNLYLKVSENSITANANPGISDSEVAEEIFRLASLNGKDIMSLEPRGSVEFKRAFYEMQENYVMQILAKNPQKNLNNIEI